MNFEKAAEIAKKHLGSSILRGSDGLFVVRLPDGTIVSEPSEVPVKELGPREFRDEHTTARVAAMEGRVRALEQEVNANQTMACEATQELEKVVASIQQELSELTRRVTVLEEAIAKIPVSEWARYDQENEQLRREQQQAESTRLLSLAREGQLSYEQLMLVMDNAGRLGISGADLAFIRDEFLREANARRSTLLYSSAFFPHSKTDGQD